MAVIKTLFDNSDMTSDTRRLPTCGHSGQARSQVVGGGGGAGARTPSPGVGPIINSHSQS